MKLFPGEFHLLMLMDEHQVTHLQIEFPWLEGMNDQILDFINYYCFEILSTTLPQQSSHYLKNLLTLVPNSLKI